MAKVSVSIGSKAFSPSAVECKVGDTVCFTNGDKVAHSVTDDDCDTTGCCSGDIAPGASHDRTYADKGTFAFHCKHVPAMKGTVTVS